MTDAEFNALPKRNEAPQFLGRVPPHSLEAEEYLLSCCLLDGGETLAKCVETKLNENAFSFPPNRLIYGSLCELYRENKPIAPEVLIEELSTGQMLEAIGGVPYILQVSGRIPTTAQAVYFIEKVRELYTLRELIKVGTATVEKAFAYQGGEVSTLILETEQGIAKLTQTQGSSSVQSIGKTKTEAMAVIDKMIARRGEYTGVASGFKDLDNLTFGFQKQEMIIIAARPSMGKSALGFAIADHATIPPKGTPTPTLIFSLEMSAAQVAIRLYCARSRVSLRLLRTGMLGKNSMESMSLITAIDEISKAPLWIDDSSKLTIGEIQSRARTIAAKVGLGLIIVDYLQLISSEDRKMPREQQVAEASRGMKAMAKELDVPVIVLSQLNRASEKEKRLPRLSDLSSSGAIEQDADVVLMMTRPPDSDERYQTAGEAVDVIVAKQRNGPVGELRLTFLKDVTRFENYAQ